MKTPLSYFIVFCLFAAPPLAAKLGAASEGGSGADETGGTETIRIIGRVEKMTRVPDPKKADYKDCLVCAKITPLKILAGKMDMSPFLAVLWGFKSRIVQPASKIADSSLLEMEVVPFKAVEKKYESIMTIDEVNDLDLPLYFVLKFAVSDMALEKNGLPPTPVPGKDQGHVETVKEEVPAKSGNLTISEERRNELDRRSEEIKRRIDLLKNEISANGGWEKWNESLNTYRAGLADIKPLNTNTDGSASDIFMSQDKWLFTSEEKGYLLSEDIASADNERTYDLAFECIKTFSDQLKAKGIDLIVIPAPVKMEFVYGRFGLKAKVPPAILRKKFILRLLLNDVEAVDLEPAFRKACENGGSIYRPDDSHWAPTAPEIAAQITADILKRYSFADTAPKENFTHTRETVSLTVKKNIYDTLLKPLGYPESFKFEMDRVFDGQKQAYKDCEDSPILVYGDSWSWIYSEMSAGFTAQLAADLSMPVSFKWQNSGGSLLPVLIKRRPELLKGRKILVWLFSSKFLWCNPTEYNRPDSWIKVKLD